MASIDPISVTGLRDLQAALKAMDGESQKQLRVVLNSVAATVVEGTRRRMPTKTGAAKASVRALSGQREAKVVEGGKKAPYTPWLDYGGTIGRGRTGGGQRRGGTNGRTKRPFVADGRYLYETYRRNKASIIPALQKAITDLCHSVGLEVD